MSTYLLFWARPWVQSVKVFLLFLTKDACLYAGYFLGFESMCYRALLAGLTERDGRQAGSRAGRREPSQTRVL